MKDVFEWMALVLFAFSLFIAGGVWEADTADKLCVKGDPRVVEGKVYRCVEQSTRPSGPGAE